MTLTTIKTLFLALATIGYFVIGYKLLNFLPSIHDTQAKKWVRILSIIILLQSVLMLVMTLLTIFPVK